MVDNEKCLILLKCKSKDIPATMINEGVRLSELPVDVLLGMKKDELPIWFYEMLIGELSNRIR